MLRLCAGVTAGFICITLLSSFADGALQLFTVTQNGIQAEVPGLPFLVILINRFRDPLHFC